MANKKGEFVFELTEAQQELNPGYGCWRHNVKPWTIVQTGQGKYTDYIPCVHTGPNSMKGVDGWEAQPTFEAALARLEATDTDALIRQANQPIPPGYMVTSTGDVVLAEDWDEIEGIL